MYQWLTWDAFYSVLLMHVQNTVAHFAVPSAFENIQQTWFLFKELKLACWYGPLTLANIPNIQWEERMATTDLIAGSKDTRRGRCSSGQKMLLLWTAYFVHFSYQLPAVGASSWDPPSHDLCKVWLILLTVSFRPQTPSTISSSSYSSCIITSTVLIHAEAVIFYFYRWLNPVKIAPRKQWIPNRALPSFSFIFHPNCQVWKVLRTRFFSLFLSAAISTEPVSLQAVGTQQWRVRQMEREGVIEIKKVTTNCPATLYIAVLYQKQDLRQLNCS